MIEGFKQKINYIIVNIKRHGYSQRQDVNKQKEINELYSLFKVVNKLLTIS